MNTDPIADLLTRIRNAAMVGFPAVKLPASREKKAILQVIEDGGYIAGYSEKETDSGQGELEVRLKYDVNGTPTIKEIARLSKPGRRLYVGKEKLPYHRGGLGLIVVSTSKGMMSAESARKEGIGGELICSLF